MVRRRQRIDQRARDRRTAGLLARPRDHRLAAPALGIVLDGDLGSWRQGRYVVPPVQLRGKAMAVVGALGAGKTVTLLRLAYLAGLLLAAVARLCGVAPIPASSGKTSRHRLSRGGNRDANRALYMLAVSRLRWDPRTRAYVARRTREGKTTREIIRCLKRHLARETYRALTIAAPTLQPAADATVNRAG